MGVFFMIYSGLVMKRYGEKFMNFFSHLVCCFAWFCHEGDVENGEEERRR